MRRQSIFMYSQKLVCVQSDWLSYGSYVLHFERQTVSTTEIRTQACLTRWPSGAYASTKVFWNFLAGTRAPNSRSSSSYDRSFVCTAASKSAIELGVGRNYLTSGNRKNAHTKKTAQVPAQKKAVLPCQFAAFGLII